MSNHHGDFIWYELITPDPEAAQQFYGTVLGWQFRDSGQQGMDYRLVQARDDESGEVHEVGGLLTLNADMAAGGASPIWLGYIAVNNVDETIVRLVESGATVLMPAEDIPDVGRIAMLADPQGVPFYIMRPAGEGVSMAFAFDRPRSGHCAWNELVTTDVGAAKSFYFGEFGWQKDGELDMGPMGAYEFLRHGGVIGAMMKKPEPLPRGGWNYYFRVPNIDLAVERISEGGGTLLQGPDEIPGGDFTVTGLDPQGALFSLVGARLRV